MENNNLKRYFSAGIIVMVILFSNITSDAQTPEFDWAKNAGGTNDDRGYGIATDGSGNSIVTGYFRGTATFGTISLTSVSSGGDIFIAKYDASGSALWAKQAGGMFGSYQGYGAATDGSGNSVITGMFSQSVTFGDGEINETTLTSTGSWDIFIAKYDASGNLIWAKQAGGSTGSDYGYGIATDGSGNIFITGHFYGTAIFGSGEPNEATLISTGYLDIFIAKYGSSGNLLWAKSAGGSNSDDYGKSIATDGSGNSIITGWFSGIVDFGTINLTSAGSEDIFIAKYDASGNVLWAKKAGGTSGDRGYGIAVDGSGNIVITGYFYSSTATFGTINLTSLNTGDIFIAKYGPLGDALWAKMANGYSHESGFGIATDGEGKSVITGYFMSSTITFGAGEPNETNLTRSGSTDVFIAKYDVLGNLLWAKQAGGTDEDYGYGIATDESNNSVIAGYFLSGAATFGSNILTNAGNSDIFVAKVEVEISDTTPPSMISDLDISSDTATSITLSWTASGDDGTDGTATTYDVRYSTSKITDDSWYTASEATGEPSPQVSGSTETFIVTNLSENITYYFAVKTADERGNWSSLSNVVDLFSDINANLVGVGYGSAAWGDYDNDGDLDILLTGYSNSGWISKIYRNDDENFADITASIAGADSNSVAWGDYDNDGDLDILITYSSSSRIYRNDEGTFVDINASLPAVSNCGRAVAWGDYDNDGDLDILLTGNSTSGKIAKVFRNDDGSDFVDISTTLTGVSGSAVAWGDYDNDGDLDILLTGLSNSGEISKIYRNDGEGSFVDINATLTGIKEGAVDWGDYDNDGDLDILLCGNPGVDYLSKIYRNDNGNFTDIAAPLTQVYGPAVGWGDYDNDGDLDIFLAGDWASGLISTIYRNEGGNFVDMDVSFRRPIYGSIDWGDYDNDGDLDILLVGPVVFPSDYIAKVYRNNCRVAHPNPPSPEDLAAFVSGNNVLLSWNQETLLKATNNIRYYKSKHVVNANDGVTLAQTEQNDNTFNLRVGSRSNGVEVASPMADISTGFRKIPQIGNTNKNESWTLKNLPAGTYYWSVQSIDNTYAGSGFAEEKSFTIIQTYTDVEAASTGLVIFFNEGGADPGDGRGVDITFSSLSGSGSATVKQTNASPSNTPGTNGCDYNWDISKESGITSFFADLIFHYTTADATGYTESAAYFGIAQYNEATNTWQWLGGTVNADNNTVTVSGVTSFSTFALFRRIFGDCTGDGYVDAADLQRLGDCWHQTNSGEFTAGSDARFFNYNKNTDSGNQIIDAADLQVFGDCWHNGVAQ